MTPAQFIARWQNNPLSERAAAPAIRIASSPNPATKPN
jgi:hypothetical protein